MAKVLITGGSRGIGAAAVELFAAQGHQVYFLYEKNHEAAKAVAEKTGAAGICCDVASSAAVAAPIPREEPVTRATFFIFHPPSSQCARQ